MDIIQCDELGAKVPGHRQEQLLQTFDVRLLKRTCFCCSNWESHCSILPGGRSVRSKQSFRGDQRSGGSALRDRLSVYR